MIVGADGKQVSKVEGPFFWVNTLPNGEPDFSHCNILFRYKGEDYMVQLPLMQVKLHDVKGEPA